MATKKTDWEAPFLEQMRAGANVQQACARIGLHPNTMYYRRKTCPAFAAAFAAASSGYRWVDRSWHPAIIAQLRAGASINEAARRLGLSKTSIYQHLKRDPEFEAAFNAARGLTRPIPVSSGGGEPDEDIDGPCSHPDCPRLAIWQASYCDHHWTILTAGAKP